MPRKNLYSWIRVDNTEKVDLIVLFLQDSLIVLPIPKKQDHLRMNVAPDQTIILGLQIFLDHRSLSSIDQKILMDLDGLRIILDHLSSY